MQSRHLLIHLVTLSECPETTKVCQSGALNGAFEASTFWTNEMRVARTENRACVKVHNPVAMVASPSTVWRSKDVDTVNALRAVTASDWPGTSVIALRSLKTIRIEKLFSHAQIWSSKTPREKASVCVIIHVHEENDFIARILPGQELLDEISGKGGVWREVTSAVGAKITTMLRPNREPTTRVISS
jgi:hypothetical protein